MFWAILAVLLLLWFLGFMGHVAGGFIHLLIVAAVGVIVMKIVSVNRMSR